jgi:hypothetical protein
MDGFQCRGTGMTGADSPRDGAAATRIPRISRAITGAISGTTRRRANVSVIDPRGPISTSKGCGYSVRRFGICAPAIASRAALRIAGRIRGSAAGCGTCPRAGLYSIRIAPRLVRYVAGTRTGRPRCSIPRCPRIAIALVIPARPCRIRRAHVLVCRRTILPALPGRGRPAIAPVIRTGRRNIAGRARLLVHRPGAIVIRGTVVHDVACPPLVYVPGGHERHCQIPAASVLRPTPVIAAAKDIIPANSKNKTGACSTDSSAGRWNDTAWRNDDKILRIILFSLAEKRRGVRESYH